jgi:hypothetical protein
MALRYAVMSGNWSNPLTWNGLLSTPSNGDTVVANGFIVTIDQDITIGGANNPSVNAGSFVTGQWYQITTVGTTSWTSIGASSNSVGVVFQATGNGGATTGIATARATITTTAISPAVSGGGFSLSTSRIITTDIRGGTTACLTVSGAINISVSGLLVVGASTQTAYVILWGSTGIFTLASCSILGGSGGPCIQNTTTGTISLNSCTIQAGSSTNISYAILNASTGSVLVTGSTITAGNANQSATAILNNANGSVTITSSTITGGGPVTANSYGVNNAANGTVVISGSNLVGSSAPAVINILAGAVDCTGCTFTAGTGAGSAFVGSSTTAIVTLNGSRFDALNGTAAVFCQRFRLSTTPTLMQYRFALNGTSTSYTLFGSDFGVFGNPATTDVRSGVNYGGGGLTGTAAIPAAGSVALGVPVDATTGTAVLTAANVQTALTSQGLTTARATNLDNLDATITSRSTLTKSDVQGAVIPLL